MSDLLTVVIRGYLGLFMSAAVFCGLLVAAAVILEQAALDLVADVRLAMKRADLSLKWVALSIRAPQQKLSDQLQGKAPFTFWCRYYCAPMLATEFWPEFRKLRAERDGDHYLRGSLGRLMRRLDSMAGEQSQENA